MPGGGSPPLESLRRAAALLNGARHAVALTGAGMSVDSGIPPFRGPGGLWERFDPEEYGHAETLRHAPEKAWVLFRLLAEAVARARPHAGHRALARLEERGLLGAIVTQNVDALHQRAGSRRVVEFHGTAERLHCADCAAPAASGSLPPEPELPRCPCGGVLRPAVVLFGEAIPADALEAAGREMDRCDLLLVVGTSATVYPAAALPGIARERGVPLVEINPEPTPLSAGPGALALAAPAVEALPRLAELALDRDGA